MPQTPSAPRWRALTDLTIEQRSGEPPLRFRAGDEVIGFPEGWPKKAIVDQEWVVEIPADAPSVDEKGSK